MVQSDSKNPPLVLVVDDEPLIREVMVYALLDQGYRVLEARDGREAVDLVRRERPALIVLDMNLPLLSGEEVAEALRREGPIPPILVVTASGSPAARAKRAGAAGFLEKPFGIDEFIRTAKQLLGL